MNEDIGALREYMAAQERELERWRHDVTVEGDFVCPGELAASNLRDEKSRLNSRVEALEAELREARSACASAAATAEAALRRLQEAEVVVSEARSVAAAITFRNSPRHNEELLAKVFRAVVAYDAGRPS